MNYSLFDGPTHLPTSVIDLPSPWNTLVQGVKTPNRYPRKLQWMRDVNLFFSRAVVVTPLVDRLLATPEVRG